MTFIQRAVCAVCAQELVRTEPDFLTAQQFGELKVPIMRRLELRKKDLQAKGLTSCLFCVHMIFNIAGAASALDV